MKIFIAAPAGVYTGGPTALFQLCRELKMFDIDASIAFYGRTKEDPVHPNYKKYGCSWIYIDNIKDDKNVVIIVPETATHLMKRFIKAKKVIYWLAVDNYVLTIYKPSIWEKILYIYRKYMLDPYLIYAYIQGYIYVYFNAFKAEYVNKLINEKKIYIPNADLHLAQSKYAKEFLLDHNIEHDKIIMIREPLEEEFINNAGAGYDMKDDLIAWNARKAYPVSFKLINLLKRRGFTVFELKNVGKKLMLKILSKTKLFVDIGIHPGRDRPLREAIVMNNMAIVNNHGGYYYQDDCMIPEEFKLNCYLDCMFNYNQYLRNIEYYIENYKYYIKKFYSFKNHILHEPYIFQNDVKELAKILNEWIKI